jgi:amidase
MRERGAAIIDPANIPTARDLTFLGSELPVLLYEFKANLNRYLTSLGPSAPVRSLAEVIEFNESHAAQELLYFDQNLFHIAEEMGPLSDPAYRDALERTHRSARQKGIDAVMDQFQLDALVMPTTCPPWTIDLVNGDHILGIGSSPAAQAGYPLVTVPAGFSFGLPVGLLFTGRAFSEPTLIKLAYAFEQATQARHPPQFVPTSV